MHSIISRWPASLVSGACILVLLSSGIATGATPASAGASRATYAPATSGYWTNLSLAHHPPKREWASMTYDARDGYVLLFGGIGNKSLLDDTWKFSGGVWTQLHPSVSPSPRYGAAMAYDPAIGKVVLFGGEDLPHGNYSTSFLSDTWAFSGGRWTQLYPGTAPAARAFASMAYDARDGYLVLFGGQAPTTANGCNTPAQGCFASTWKMVGKSWVRISANSGPPHMWQPLFVYDAADSYLLLAGVPSYAPWTAWTWTFYSGAWHQITTRNLPGPSPSGLMPEGAASAYDPATKSVVMFGGLYDGPCRGPNATAHASRCTFLFSNGNWKKLTLTVSPPPQIGDVMTYDVKDRYVVFFGGQTHSGSANLAETWTFS